MYYQIEKSQPFLLGRLKRLFYLALIMLLTTNLMRFVYAYLFLDWLEAKRNYQFFWQSLWLGQRYDLIPICYILFLPYLGYWTTLLNPRESWMKAVNFMSRLWIYLGFLLVVFILVCDIAFYSYYSEHINAIFFGLFEDDTSAVLSSIWKNYNVPLWLLLIAGYLYVLWRLIAKVLHLERIDLGFQKPYPSKFMSSFFVVGLCFLIYGARGSFDRLPLSIEDSYISTFEKINHLSVNGVIALNRALRIRREFGLDNTDYLKKYGFSQIDDALKAAGFEGNNLQALVKTTDLKQASSFPHVVFALVESWGSYWWDEESEDFQIKGSFARHELEDWFFPYILPSENGTIGSLTSILSGVPVRPGSRYLSEGKFAKTFIPSAIHVPFKQHAYETYFLYGGKLGWRQIGSFAKAQGYQHIKGAQEIIQELKLDQKVKPRDLGNEWGIFDEYLFQYVKEILQKSDKPVFVFLLTTSNHPPYEFPQTYQKLPLKITPKRMEQMIKTPDEMEARFLALQYTNQTLGDFISNIKNSDLKIKTVIAATGDHSFWVAKNPGVANEARKYFVPFYLYVPTEMRTVQPDFKVIGSHLDLGPTLFELLLPETQYYGFGQSLLYPDRFAYNAAGFASNQQYLSTLSENYCYSQVPLLQICPESSEHLVLRRKYQALMGLTDVFLKSL